MLKPSTKRNLTQNFGARFTPKWWIPTPKSQCLFEKKTWGLQPINVGFEGQDTMGKWGKTRDF